jgi:two-component system sensor histidine kinase KdpD
LHAESVEIKDLVTAATGRLERVLKHRKLSLDIEEGLPVLNIDPRLCQQAIVNILVNAAFNSPENSTVSLSAKRAEQVVRIVICDDGPGVPPEELMRIFEKFYRISTNQSDGVGLGLTVSRGVIRAHNGRISAQNRKEGGLCITIDLPISE